MNVPGTKRGARLAGPFVVPSVNQRIDEQVAQRTQAITGGVRQADNSILYVNPAKGNKDYLNYVQEKLKPRSPIPGKIVPVTKRNGETLLPPDAFNSEDPIGAARAALNTVGQRLEQTPFAPADYDKAVFGRAANAIAQDDPRLAPYLDEYQQALGDRLARKDRVILPGDAPVNGRTLSYREEGGEQEHDPTEVFTQNKPSGVVEIDDGEGYEESEPTVFATPPEETRPVRGSEEKKILGDHYAVVDNNTLNEEAATKGSQLRPDGGDKHLFPKDKNTTGSGPYNDDITAPSFTFTGAGSGVLEKIKNAMDAGDVDTVNQIFAGYPSKSGGTIPVIRNYTIPAMDPRLRQFVIGVDGDGTHRVRLPSGKELDVPGGLQGEFDPINFWKAVGNQETPIHRVKKTSEVWGRNEETGALIVRHPEHGGLTDFYPVPSLDETGYHNGRLGTKYRYDLDAIHEDMNDLMGALYGIEGPPPRLQSLHEGLSWGGIYGLKRAPSLGTSFLDVTRAEINNLSVPEQTGYGGRARGNPTIASSDRVDQILRERIDMMTNELAQPDLPDTRRAELLVGREQALAAMQPENRDPGKIAARTAAAIAREAAARKAVEDMGLRARATEGDDEALAQLPADQHEQIQRLREVHRQQAAGIPDPTTENVLKRGEGPNRFLGMGAATTRKAADGSAPWSSGRDAGSVSVWRRDDPLDPPLGRRTNDVIKIVDGPTVDPDKLLARRTLSGGGGPSRDRIGLGPKQDSFDSTKEPTTPGAMVTYPIGRLLELPPEEQARALQTVPSRALPAPGIAETGGDFKETAIQIAEGSRSSQDVDFLRIPAEQLAGLPAVQGYGGGPRRAILPAVRTPVGTISARPGTGARPGEPIFVRGAQEVEAPTPRDLEGASLLGARAEVELPAKSGPAESLQGIPSEAIRLRVKGTLPLDVGYVADGASQLRADQAAARLRAGLAVDHAAGSQGPQAAPGARISKAGLTRPDLSVTPKALRAHLTPSWEAFVQGPHVSEAALQDALTAARQVLDQST